MLLSVEMQNEIDAKRRKDGKKKDKKTSKKEGQAFLDGMPYVQEWSNLL